jgi:TolA-binding protein
MKTLSSRAASTLILVSLATVLASPVHAMGRSGAPTPTKPTHTAADQTARQTPAGDNTQTQIDALKKEVAELKAQLATVASR